MLERVSYYFWLLKNGVVTINNDEHEGMRFLTICFNKIQQSLACFLG